MPSSASAVVEQHPGAGAALPVHVPHARPGEVFDAAEPERVTRRHHQPLLPVHQPHDRDVRGGRAEHAVHVRQRVLPRGDVEQVRSGDVAQPVAQRDQPAERADVGGRQRDQRVVRAQRGGGQVEHEVVRADRDDGPRDLVQAAQQFHRDRRRQRGALPPRRAPPAARRRGPARSARPAPRGSGVATSSPPTEPSRTRTQSSMPSGDASLRASFAAVSRAPRGGAPDSSASTGDGEDVEGQRGGHRVAGRAEHRRAARRRRAPPGARGGRRPRAPRASPVEETTRAV